MSLPPLHKAGNRTRPGLPAIALLALALIMAACQAAPRKPAPTSDPAPAPKAAEEPPPPRASPPPPATVSSLPPPQGVPPEAVIERRFAAARIDPFADPARLNGMDAATVAALLGPPSLARDEPPARLWQFTDGTCILDLILYQSGPTHTVAHVETRDRTGAATPGAECLRGIIVATAAASSG